MSFCGIQVRGISSIQRLSVTQLNSEEPFVAAVTLVADAGNTAPRENFSDENDGGGQGLTPGRLLAAGTAALAESVKRVLDRHNIGRNTVEIVVLPPGDSRCGPFGSLGEAARGESGSRGGEDRAACLSAGDEAERGHIGAGAAGESGGKSHGGHSHAHGHGQCSGHGHSHGHAAASVDLV